MRHIMGMSLYELNSQYQAAMEMMDSGIDSVVDTETGEILDINSLLDGLKISLDEKIDNTVLYLKSLSAEETAIKAEIESLQKRLDAKEKKRERLENYLLLNLPKGTKKRERPQYKLSVSESEQVIVPKCVLKLPAEYLTEHVTITAKKADIKKALKAGQTVAGCSIKKVRYIKY